MSAFSSIALPGVIPESCSSGRSIDPDSLFSNSDKMKSFSDTSGMSARSSSMGCAKVKAVKVRIFDLSDKKQVSEYEKLWAELIEKSYRMEVLVDCRKDLVRRENGTSYWMKYVEYVEFEKEGEKIDLNSNKKGAC